MEFQRKKKPGFEQKTRRLWLSDEGYRIVWRTEVHGVRVPRAFQACVQIVLPGSNREVWDFVDYNERRYQSMAAAIAACERHQKLQELSIKKLAEKNRPKKKAKKK